MFLGQNQSKVPVALSRILQPFGTDVEYLQISGSGPNAVDFYIAFYIGRLAASHPDAKFTIVSKDTGFDPLVKHLTSLKIACNRSKTRVRVHLECVAAAMAVAPGQPTSTSRPIAARLGLLTRPQPRNLRPQASNPCAQPQDSRAQGSTPCVQP